MLLPCRTPIGPIRILIGGVLALLLLTGCGVFSDKDDPTADWSAKKLYDEGHAAVGNSNWESAIDYFEKLETRYPFGPYAQQGQIEIIYAYYKFGEPASAIAAADRFIKLHPRHPSVDYAYYLKGLTNYNQGKGLLDAILPIDGSQRDPGAARAAFDDFAQLVKLFPESKYAEDAAQRMLFLRENLAKYEIHVADYYMRRKAYVAAANRAKYVVENYQRTPAVPDALVIMAKAYDRLNMTDLSADAVRVLKLNYPDHPALGDLEHLGAR